jgi:DNA polymerase-3 subunit beta
MSKTLTVDARELSQELAWITRAMRAKQYTPALSAVHISALVGALQLRRADFELWAQTSVYVDGGGQASVLVDPVKLASVLKGERGDVDIDITDTGLTVTVGGRTTTLRSSANLDDYPQWPVFVEGDTGAAILSTEEVARGLTSVGEDPGLPNLTGVRFEDRVMVSTNRIRLTRVNYTGCGKPMAALIPATALRTFTRGEEFVTIESGKLGADGAEGGMVHVHSGQRSIIARVLDGEFPKWRQLVPDPEAATVRVVLRRDDLLPAIGADDHDVTLTITGEATMRVVDADRDGDVQVEQQVRLVGTQRADEVPFTVRLKAANLRACLKGSSAVCTLEATTPHKPVVLRALSDAEFHLIMPIKIPA